MHVLPPMVTVKTSLALLEKGVVGHEKCRRQGLTIPAATSKKGQKESAANTPFVRPLPRTNGADHATVCGEPDATPLHGCTVLEAYELVKIKHRGTLAALKPATTPLTRGASAVRHLRIPNGLATRALDGIEQTLALKVDVLETRARLKVNAALDEHDGCSATERTRMR